MINIVKNNPRFCEKMECGQLLRPYESEATTRYQPMGRCLRNGSRILLTFTHVENSCEINPSHMVFMIFNFAHLIQHDSGARENVFCMVFHVRWISHHSSPIPTFVASDSGGIHKFVVRIIHLKMHIFTFG